MDTRKLDNLNEFCGLWKPIIIDDQQFSICIEEKNERWNILLTNLQEIWLETLDVEKIHDKSQKLNPNLSIEDVDVVEFVKELLKNVEKKATKRSTQCIEFNENLEGGIFKFSIDFEKGTCKQLWEKVTSRLCLYAGELLRRQNILLDLINKKDEELTEYRLNGAELTRKHIETKPFNKDLFKQHFLKLEAKQVFDTFESVMNSQDEFEPLIGTESSFARTAEMSALVEESIKNENEIKKEPEKSSVKSLTENDSVKIEDGSSETSVAKIAKANSSLPKRSSKNDDDEIRSIRRKARSAPSLITKRSKTSIQNFIS